MAVADWLPDGNRFIVNARPAVFDADWSSIGTDIWLISTKGATPRLLRRNALGWSVSPDGASIAFTTEKKDLGDREIWLMDVDNGVARRIFEAEKNEGFGGVLWLADGKRLLYLSIGPAGNRLLSRDLQGGPASVVLSASEVRGVNDLAMLPGSRLIYARAEPGAITTTANYWIMPLDRYSGTPQGPAKRLTDWSGFGIAGTTAADDGRRLAFRRWTALATINMADLVAGGNLRNSQRHFTLTESFDWPLAWARDSQSLIIVSNRTGMNEIYRQLLDQNDPQLLVSGQPGVTDAEVSPDGKWVLFLRSDDPADDSSPAHLMRVPLAGGPPEELSTASGGASLSCAASPSTLCILGQLSRDRRQLIIFSLDLQRGVGGELLRFDHDPKEADWCVDLSPDGTRLAILEQPEAPIGIVSIADGSRKSLKNIAWTNLSALHWSSDGRSLFASSATTTGSVLLQISLQGPAKIVADNPGGKWIPAVPSPDGHHLAFARSLNNSNMWMMELF